MSPDPAPDARRDTPGLDRTDHLALHRLLWRTRAVEERLTVLQKRGLVHGGVYLSLGQEASAVGAAYALRRRPDGTGDLVAPSIRGCGVHLTFGAGPELVFRQHLARATGPSRGRESGAGWGDRARGIVAPVMPLGVLVQVMAGVALACRLRGEDRVAMVFSGDGAAATGAWHEGVSLATAQACPLVLVLENNRWAFSTPTERSTRVRSFAEKGVGYGFPAESVDGTDVVAVHAAVAAAVAEARAGAGMRLVELRTFRRAGHAQHDAQEYVDPEERAAWEAKDPIALHREHARRLGWAEEHELDAIEAQEREACAAAAESVLSEPEPEGVQALAGVYGGAAVEAPWTRTPSLRPAAAGSPR